MKIIEERPIVITKNTLNVYKALTELKKEGLSNNISMGALENGESCIFYKDNTGTHYKEVVLKSETDYEPITFIVNNELIGGETLFKKLEKERDITILEGILKFEKVFETLSEVLSEEDTDFVEIGFRTIDLGDTNTNIN